MTEVYRGVWVIAYRELLRFVQDRPRILSSFAMPLLFLVVFGAGFGRVIPSQAPGVGYVQFMYPGIISMTVLMTSIFAGISVVWDREFGFLREVLVAPLSRTGVVLGKAVGGACVALVQGVVMLVLAPFLSVSLSWTAVLELIPLLIVLSIVLSGLGIFIAARMRSQQGFQLLMQLLIFPLIFTAGVFYPVNNVPVWLEVIAKINPATYGVDAVRQIMLGTTQAAVVFAGHRMTILDDFAIVLIIGAIFLSAAVYMFNRQE